MKVRETGPYKSGWSAWVIAFLTMTGVLACDNPPSRRIVGDYRLGQFGLIGYHIERDGADDRSGGGILRGDVVRIGWNDAWIVAWRRGMGDRDASGWMIINVKEDSISGPLSDEAFAAKREADPQLHSIELLPVEKAWSKLSWPW
jgi:hypothetical protein